MRIRHIVLMLAVATPPLALAQNIPAPTSSAAATAVTKPLAFEVVTIKPSRAPGWNMYPTRDGYHGIGISLRQLVREAYGVFDPNLLIGGAAWMDSDKFDIDAKFDPSAIPNTKDLTYRQRADMLRAVLADRFQLKVHSEKKTFPIYDLVVATGGAKLQEAPAEHLHSAPLGRPIVPAYQGPRRHHGSRGLRGGRPRRLTLVRRWTQGHRQNRSHRPL